MPSARAPRIDSVIPLDRGEEEDLLDCTPDILANQHSVATLTRDGQRFRIFGHLVDQAIQVRPGGRHTVESSRVVYGPVIVSLVM